MRGRHGAAALALVGALLSPLSAAAEEPPHVRVELIAGPDLPACDREDDFRIVLSLALNPRLLNPPTTHVLRARFRKVPGGYGVDLALSGPGGSGVETRHREYVGVCCFEAMYLAAKESALMLEGKAPASSTPSAPVCSPCPVCKEEGAPGSAPAPQSIPSAPMAATSSKKRDFPRVELDVAPDLRACLRPDDLQSLLEELVVRGIRTDTVLHVRIRRSPRGGFAVDVQLDDEEGNPLGATHLDYPDICCFEVLYLAATHGAGLLYGTRTEQSKAEPDSCPPCRPCPPEVPAPSPPAPVAPVRRSPARVEQPRSTLTRRLMPGVLVGTGIASGWGPGVQLGGDVRFARWSFELDASVMFPVSFEADAAKTSSAWSRAWTVSGSLVPCRWFDEGLAGCLVGSAGVLLPTRPRTYTNVDLWGFASAGLRGVWEPPMLRGSNFGLRLEGELAWAFWRPENRDPDRVPLPAGGPLVSRVAEVIRKWTIGRVGTSASVGRCDLAVLYHPSS